jgi:hypothetical protein
MIYIILRWSKPGAPGHCATVRGVDLFYEERDSLSGRVFHGDAITGIADAANYEQRDAEGNE